MDIVEKQKRDYFRRQFCFHLERYKKAGKTQKEFCIEAGVNKNSVTGWKQGKSFPHDAQLIKICEVLGIDQRALTTPPPDEQHFIDNSAAKARSEELQKYAEEKGLNDEWFSYFMSQRKFLQKFPFHHQFILITDERLEMFPPVKFQIVDDSGHRTMMSEEDIDFLIEVQNKTDSEIINSIIVEKQKIKDMRIEEMIDYCLKYFDLDREEVTKRLERFELKDRNHELTEQDVSKTFHLLAREKGIRPHIRAKELMEMHHESPELIKKREIWAMWNGTTEDEIIDMRKTEEEFERMAIQDTFKSFRDAGFLIEDDKGTEV